MVIQLDEEVKNGLTLQKLWYYVQPSCKVMESLVGLIHNAVGLRGGQLLSCIFTMLNSTTEEQIKGIYGFLFNKALSVYIQLMERWIYEGVINDKFEEFMVFEQVDVRKDNR
jgi:gamma-tubulin complex component 2